MVIYVSFSSPYPIRFGNPSLRQDAFNVGPAYPSTTARVAFLNFARDGSQDVFPLKLPPIFNTEVGLLAFCTYPRTLIYDLSITNNKGPKLSTSLNIELLTRFHFVTVPTPLKNPISATWTLARTLSFNDALI